MYKRQSLFSGECGHYSMVHAFAKLGLHEYANLNHFRTLTGVGAAKAMVSGIDADVILATLQTHSPMVKVTEHYFDNWATMLAELERLRNINGVMIVSVRDGAHWAVIGFDKDSALYTTIDSSWRRHEVVKHMTAAELLEWVAPVDEYYGISLEHGVEAPKGRP